MAEEHYRTENRERHQTHKEEGEQTYLNHLSGSCRGQGPFDAVQYIDPYHGVLWI